MTPEWNDEFYCVPNEVQDRAQTEKYNDNEEYKCYGWQNRREEFFVRRVRTERRRAGRLSRVKLCRIWAMISDTEVQFKVHVHLYLDSKDVICLMK